MKAKSRQSGLTLTEMVVVVATIALLVGLGVPAVRTFLSSFESRSGARSMISAALASARAIAAKEQRYAGIRFQKDLDDNQYMVYIVHDPEIGAYFFRAAEGLKPIKLPESIGAMDLRIRTSSNEDNSANIPIEVIGNDTLSNSNIDNIWELRDTTSFSIVFSPSGKLIRHDVRIRNRNGYKDSSSDTRKSDDDVFNKLQEVDDEIGMFYQDDYSGTLNGTNLGLGKEPSRRSFIIYDRVKFKQAYEKGRAYSDYLVKLIPDAIYINPYTGTIISAD